jgi:hypothetical protein
MKTIFKIATLAGPTPTGHFFHMQLAGVATLEAVE